MFKTEDSKVLNGSNIPVDSVQVVSSDQGLEIILPQRARGEGRTKLRELSSTRSQ